MSAAANYLVAFKVPTSSVATSAIAYTSQKGVAIAVTIAVVIVAVWITLLSQDRRSRRASGVLLGKDGRLSTSKTVAAAWTIVVAYILIALIITWPADWDRALTNFGTTYVLLLGGPYAALVAAKGIVSARVGNGTLAKPPAATSSLADLVNDDTGQPDLFDVQYLIFNTIAIVFVLTAFGHATLDGFPTIPNALVLLTGGPAAIYVSNKFFGSDLPAILGVSPSTVTVGSTFTISGQNLNTADGTFPSVAVGADDAVVKAATAVSIVAVAPNLGAGLGQRLTVSVKTGVGTTVSLNDCLQVTAPVPTLYGASRGSVNVGDAVDLTGDWGDVPREQLAAVFDGSVLAQPRSFESGRLQVVVPDLSDTASPRRVQVTVRAYGNISNPVTIEVSGQAGNAAKASVRTNSSSPAVGSYVLTR